MIKEKRVQPLSTLPAALYPLLRCPVCKQPLKQQENRFVCVDDGCGSIFPTVHGIPVLLNEQRSVFTIDDFVRQRPTFFKPPRMRPIELIEQLLPELQRADKARQWYERFTQLLLERSPNPLVLVVGGGIEGRGMKPLLQYCPPIQLVDSDVSFGPRTMLICDAHDIPFADGTFDGVVAQAVLEHVVDPARCVEEIHRVLKHDALVYAQTPFMQQVHGGAYDFTRFTLLGHRRLFRKFAEIESGAGNGPGAALAWSWQYFLLSFATSWWARGLIRSFVRLTAFWLKYVDIYLERKPGMLDAATGYFFLGRKSDKLLSDRELITLYRGGLVR
jgi:SAM-dependent methyltransferase